MQAAFVDINIAKGRSVYHWLGRLRQTIFYRVHEGGQFNLQRINPMNPLPQADSELEQRASSSLMDVLIRASLIGVLAVLCYQVFSPFLTLMVGQSSWRSRCIRCTNGSPTRLEQYVVHLPGLGASYVLLQAGEAAGLPADLAMRLARARLRDRANWPAPPREARPNCERTSQARGARLALPSTC